MAASKVVEDLDKKVLECPICMKRLTQPRTLPCMHTYCLECLENWAVVKCKLQCPLCSRSFQIPDGGVHKLAPNTTINNLLEYVNAMEKERIKKEDGELAKKGETQSPCACRKSPPTHYCKECDENVCIDCKKHHKSSRLKSKKHTLLLLGVIPSAKEVATPRICNVHSNNLLEFFCKRCLKLACSRCREEFHKSTSEHLIVPVSTTCTELKSEIDGLVKMARKVKTETQSHLQTFETNAAKLSANRDACKRSVDAWMEDVVRQIDTYCQALKNNIDKVDELQMHALRSKMHKSQSSLSDISSAISALENKSTNSLMLGLETHVVEVSAIRSRLCNLEFDRSEVSPNLTFVPSQEFTAAMDDGIGVIQTMEDLYRVSEADTPIYVTEGEVFTVGIDCFKGSNTSELIAKLSDQLGQETVANISQENGSYKITGRCNISGEWLLLISTGTTFIQGSPVVIHVRKGGLSVTLPNILDYMEHTKDTKVMNVLCDKEGLLIVTSAGRDVLKFNNQSGEFVNKVVLKPGTRVSGLCIVNDCLIAYSDLGNKCVTTCSHGFNEVLSFGKGVVKQPRGLAVRRDVNDIYVVDSDAHCIFRFDFQTGKLIGKIGSEGKGIGQLLKPQDLAITSDGHLLIVDFGNHRISVLDAMEKFVKIIIGCGKEDGKVVGPSGIVICQDDTFIVSSNHKLQLFDRNGTLIKRIDKEGDGLNVPVYMTLLSSKMVAVANHREDNVKIFIY